MANSNRAEENIKNFIIAQPSIQCAFDDFVINNYMHSGSFGTVYSAYRKSDNMPVAIKFFGYEHGQSRWEWLYHEMVNLFRLKKVNGIVSIVGVFFDTPSGYLTEIASDRRNKIFKQPFPVIVMERLDGPELFDRIVERYENHQTFSEKQASALFRSFITSLNDAHVIGRVINCDIKTENILFQTKSLDDNRIKIIDFGSAICLPENASHVYLREPYPRGTDLYLAPETKTSEPHIFLYSIKTDIWQAGIVLYIMLHGFPLYYIPGTAELYLEPKLSPEVKCLLSQMLHRDPNYRISLDAALQHPWINQYSSLTDKCLGETYYMKIRSWSYRRQMKALLAKRISAARLRRERLIEAVRVARLKKLREDAGGGRPSETAAGDRGLRLSFPWSTKTSVPPANPPASSGTTTTAAGAASTAVSQSSEDMSLSLSVNCFRHLQSQFVICTRDDPETKHITFPQFCAIVSIRPPPSVVGQEACKYADRSNIFRVLDLKEIFDIFDENLSGYVDYFQFLLTLTFFRKDKAEVDECRLIYDVFDMHQAGSISHDLFYWMLCSFLLSCDPGESQLSSSSSPTSSPTFSHPAARDSPLGAASPGDISPATSISSDSHLTVTTSATSTSTAAAPNSNNPYNIIHDWLILDFNEFEELFANIDKNHDNKIDFWEFKQFFDALTMPSNINPTTAARKFDQRFANSAGVLDSSLVSMHIDVGAASQSGKRRKPDE